MLLNDPDTHIKRAVASYIVHLVVLRASDLSQRSLEITPLEEEEQTHLDRLVASFSLTCKSAIEGDEESFSAVE